MNIQWMNGCAVISPIDNHLDSITVGRWFAKNAMPESPCVLDFRKVTTIDISGLSLLLRHGRHGDRGCCMVVKPGSWMESICAVVKIKELMPLFHTVDDAVAHLLGTQEEAI